MSRKRIDANRQALLARERDNRGLGPTSERPYLQVSGKSGSEVIGPLTVSHEAMQAATMSRLANAGNYLQELLGGSLETLTMGGSDG